MFKFRFHFILAICFIMQCMGLAGCTQKTDAVSHVEIDDIIPTDTEDEIDYSQYLKKIWIKKEWDGGFYMRPSSFRLTKIENGIVEGALSTDTIALPPSYQRIQIPQKYTPNLFGTIRNGVAECWFSSEEGDKGTITLVFKKNNEIEAEIYYEKVGYLGEALDKEQYYERWRNVNVNYEDFDSNMAPLDGNYIFIPFNLSYYNDRHDPLKTSSFETNLDYWGKVNFVTKVFIGNKPYPEAYLTNEHNDIFYSFGVPFQVGTEITDVLIEDMSGDGLKDIKFFCDFTPLPGEESSRDEYITWIYFQMDDGLFYDSGLGVVNDP